jgi:hypothetical protein
MRLKIGKFELEISAKTLIFCLVTIGYFTALIFSILNSN